MFVRLVGQSTLGGLGGALVAFPASVRLPLPTTWERDTGANLSGRGGGGEGVGSKPNVGAPVPLLGGGGGKETGPPRPSTAKNPCKERQWPPSSPVHFGVVPGVVTKFRNDFDTITTVTTVTTL